MKKISVKSKQPNVIASHKGNPSYEIEFGNEPIEVTEEIANHLIQNHKFEVLNDEIVKESQKEELNTSDKDFNEDYQKELEAIKGIGSKTAIEIMTLFKTKETLIEAIKRGDDLYPALDDDIVDKLIEKYKPLGGG